MGKNKLPEGFWIAHRGLHRWHEEVSHRIPENSLLACDTAIRAKIAIELDVRLTVDGVPIIFHDDILDRMTGSFGLTNSADLKDLKRLTLQETNQHIPTLAEVLERVNGQVPLYLEVKIPSPEEKSTVISAMQAIFKVLSNYRGKVIVMSFCPDAVIWLKKYAPRVPRGFITYDYNITSEDEFMHLSALQRKARRWLWPILDSEPDFIACDVSILKTMPVRLAKLWGYKVLGWNFKSQKHVADHFPYINKAIFAGFFDED